MCACYAANFSLELNSVAGVIFRAALGFTDHKSRVDQQETVCLNEVISIVISDWWADQLLMMFVFEAYAPRVDVSGLVAGILAVLMSAAIATVLGIYCYKTKMKGGRRSAQ